MNAAVTLAGKIALCYYTHRKPAYMQWRADMYKCGFPVSMDAHRMQKSSILARVRSSQRVRTPE